MRKLIRVVLVTLCLVTISGCGNSKLPASQPSQRIVQPTGPITGGEYYVGGQVEVPGAHPLAKSTTLRAALHFAVLTATPTDKVRVNLIRRGRDHLETEYDIGVLTILNTSVGDMLVQCDDQIHCGSVGGCTYAGVRPVVRMP